MTSLEHIQHESRRSVGRIVGAAGGDMLAFLGFAAIGLASHGNLYSLASILRIGEIAAPFAIGWFAVSPFFGVFHPSSLKQPQQILARTALGWLVACPIGLLLRALFTKKPIEPTFAVITFITTLLLLLSWRSVLAWYSSRAVPR